MIFFRARTGPRESGQHCLHTRVIWQGHLLLHGLQLRFGGRTGWEFSFFPHLISSQNGSLNDYSGLLASRRGRLGWSHTSRHILRLEQPREFLLQWSSPSLLKTCWTLTFLLVNSSVWTCMSLEQRSPTLLEHPHNFPFLPPPLSSSETSLDSSLLQDSLSSLSIVGTQ